MSSVRGWLRDHFLQWAHHPPASSRHEVVMALAASAVMSSFGTFVGPDVRPASVTDAVPHWVAYGWFAVLGIGGAALIASAFIRDRLDCLIVEAPAYFLLGLGALLYTACLIAAGRGTAFVVATGYLSYALACLVRTLRIGVYVHWLNRAPARRLKAVG